MFSLGLVVCAWFCLEASDYVNRKQNRQRLIEPPDAASAAPVFECENDTRFIRYEIDWANQSLSRQPTDLDPQSRDITLAWLSLARFYFNPDKNAGADSVLYLSAHIEICEADGKPLKRVIDGIWEGAALKRSKEIQQGRALELMIALIPMSDALDASLIYSVEGVEGDVEAEPDLTPIIGNEFLVRVELIPRSTDQKPFPTQPFEFRLRVPELELLRSEQFTQRPDVSGQP